MFWAPLNRLTVPLILSVSALLLRERLLTIQPAYTPLLDVLPYVTLGAAMVVAIFYNRARLFSVALGLIVSYWVVATQLQNSLADSETFIIFSLLSLMLPVTLIILMLVSEPGLRSQKGLWIVAVIPIQLTIALLLREQQAVAAAISEYMPIQSNKYGNLSIAAAACYSVCALLAASALFWKNKEQPAVILTMLVLSFLVFTLFALPKISIVLFSAAGLALISSLLRSSHDLAYRDELTGLRSRRALSERFKNLGRRYVVAMADVDHFKKFNDTYGHEVGDDVLKMVAKHLAAVKGGVAYRFGGEEFCIVFAGKDLEQCRPNIESVRLSIADYRLYVRDSQGRPQSQKLGRQRRGSGDKGQIAFVTISVGAAESHGRKKKPHDILKLADTALYKAKKKGRNRLICSL